MSFWVLNMIKRIICNVFVFAVFLETAYGDLISPAPAQPIEEKSKTPLIAGIVLAVAACLIIYRRYSKRQR